LIKFDKDTAIRVFVEEITGRKGDMQINPDGTKTMETGGKKMIYQWNDDLNIVTQQTEESNRYHDRQN
jgi:hypothetical protein